MAAQFAFFLKCWVFSRVIKELRIFVSLRVIVLLSIWERLRSRKNREKHERTSVFFPKCDFELYWSIFCVFFALTSSNCWVEFFSSKSPSSFMLIEYKANLKFSCAFYFVVKWLWRDFALCQAIGFKRFLLLYFTWKKDRICRKHRTFSPEKVHLVFFVLKLVGMVTAYWK